MQLIEVSVTGARSAVITLQAPGTPMRIILFPMLHLGTPAYYQAVTTRLADCDLIVAEGIAGRSVTAWALTLAYRLPARSGKLALQAQNIDYAGLRVPVLRPDITARRFRERWRAIPMLQRMAAWCLVPPFAVAVMVFGTRRTLSRFLATDDLPDLAESQLRTAAPQLAELVLDHRDALLLDCLTAVHDQRHSQQIDVAVAYGAGHMPAVTREMLRRHGYRPRAAEWLAIFDF